MNTIELLPPTHPYATLQAVVLEAEAAQDRADRLWNKVSRIATELGVCVVCPQMGT